jgi:endonuclease/exonuclease/phosphatase family metal-dependent hydrolase
VAIAFKQERFRLLAQSEKYHLPNEYDDIPLHQPGTGLAVDDEVKQVLLEKARTLRKQGGYGEFGGRIASFALLQDRRNPERKVIVGTTHLDKSPDSLQKSLSRINQMSVLNVIQGHLAKKWGVSLEKDIVLLAGDLNTDMREQTMVKQPALAGENYRLSQMSIEPSKHSCTTLTEDRNMWIDYIFHAGQAEVTETSYPLSPCDAIPNLEQASDHFAVTATLRWKDGVPLNGIQEFIVPKDYNWTRSTEDNYALPTTDKTRFVGPFQEIRKRLDYTYHRVYHEERQSLQDSIVNELLHAVVSDSASNLSCEAPVNSWIVFTAGGMGAGKSWTMQWLSSQDYFPLSSFVYVDPDQIRSMLPETSGYVKEHASSTGILTQKEAGYLQELLTEAALQEGKNILVDGSLRDYEWYLKFFMNLRERQPDRKIGIIHVSASQETEYNRAVARGKTTGRVIPHEIMQEAARIIPTSTSVLAPHVDFFARIENENRMPRLIEPEYMSWESFKDVWEMECPIPDDWFDDKDSS